MHSIAAYYMLIANDLARENRRPHYHVEVVRPSRFKRLAPALTSLARRGSRTTSQPA